MNNFPELRLTIESPLTIPEAINYKPLSWPPERDWPIIIDAEGSVVSRWEDSIWRLYPWAGKAICLNFGDGKRRKQAEPISSENADILRIITGWWMYGPNGARGVRSLKTRFDQMRKIFVFCTQQGILASELSKYSHVIDYLHTVINPSRSGESIALLHELYEQRDFLGFTLLDRQGLIRLQAILPDHNTSQTAYIPPRIWLYQVNRLKECLDDFLAHQDQVVKCFKFCLDAYMHNDQTGYIGPGTKVYRFKNQSSKGNNFPEAQYFYCGTFDHIASNHGVKELLQRWVGYGKDTIYLPALTKYLTLIGLAGLGYILNFSLMRVEEAWNLKTDCLQVEKDPNFGDIYILKGKTTKTMDDPDAIWVTSPTVKVAVEAMKIASSLRSMFAQKDSNESSCSEYLIQFANEPWIKNNEKRKLLLRPNVKSYSILIKGFDKLFDVNQLQITQNDIEIARLITPTLSDRFSIGGIWPLAWHQLRRTGAVNMQASGLVSESSLQFQLKHAVRSMSLYYGQNHSKLRLEEKAHTLYVRTMYETLASEFKQLTDERFLSPHGDKRKFEIVRMVSLSDANKITKLARKGTISLRPILLGICTNRTPCPYGGIDNIAHCGGGDSRGQSKPCPDVLYDKKLAKQVEDLDSILKGRLAEAEMNSPLRESLEAQIRSVKHYQLVINQKN